MKLTKAQVELLSLLNEGSRSGITHTSCARSLERRGFAKPALVKGVGIVWFATIEGRRALRAAGRAALEESRK